MSGDPRKSDPRKRSIDLPSRDWDEIEAAAELHEASRSWIVQQAWKIAREEIAKMPPSPSWAAKQREQAEPSPASSKPQPAELQRPPARPPEALLSAWEMERLHGSHHAQSGEPLDHQARELYPWDNDGPTI